MAPFRQRMRKKHFKEYICRPFCKFFREGEKEEIACLGALVVEEMVKRRRLTRRYCLEMGKNPPYEKTATLSL